MSMKEQWRLILAAYTDEKKQWDKNYPWLYFVLRPVSFVITLLVLPLKITANQFTFIDFIVGAAACGFLSMGYPEGFYIGSILFTLYNLFDTVDGNVARCTKTASPAGRFFDTIASYPFLLVYFFIGIGLQSGMFIVIGAFTTLSKFISMDVIKCFFSILGREWDALKCDGKISAGILKGYAKTWYYRLYINITDIQGHDFLLIIAAFTHTMSIFLLASMIVSLLDLILVIGVYVMRANKLKQ